MADVTIAPGTVAGTVTAPGSKSITHRAYVLAARCDAPVRIDRPLRAEDTDATLACLRALGARAEATDDQVRFTAPVRREGDDPVLDCRNAGTAMRLLAGQAATLGRRCTLDGDASLRTRPHGELLDALRGLGATIQDHDGRAPLVVRGPIQGGDVRIRGTSSQYVSSLLLALPFVDGSSTVEVLGSHSAPYIDVTRRVATAFGIRIGQTGSRYTVPGGQQASADRFTVEGDWSGAAFPLVAGALAGAVKVQGLCPDSAQGDRAILGILAAFGAKTAMAADGTATCDQGELVSPGGLDVTHTPDLFPVLAALAACARGTTTFTGGASLRHKECDRIRAMAEGLTALGVQVTERPDGLVVHGRPGGPSSGRVKAFHDHRVHMAFAVLGLAARGPVTIDGPGCEAISYPDFHADLDHLRAP